MTYTALPNKTNGLYRNRPETAPPVTAFRYKDLRRLPEWFVKLAGWRISANNSIIVKSKRGNLRVGFGDWVILQLDGKLYSLDHDNFIDYFELVERKAN